MRVDWFADSKRPACLTHTMYVNATNLSVGVQRPGPRHPRLPWRPGNLLSLCEVVTCYLSVDSYPLCELVTCCLSADSYPVVSLLLSLCGLVTCCLFAPGPPDPLHPRRPGNHCNQTHSALAGKGVSGGVCFQRGGVWFRRCQGVFGSGDVGG